jgi:hypothetical protein
VDLILGSGKFVQFTVAISPEHSYVIPSEVEGPRRCGTRHTSRRGPSTALRMTTLIPLMPLLESLHAETLHQFLFENVGFGGCVFD